MPNIHVRNTHAAYYICNCIITHKCCMWGDLTLHQYHRYYCINLSYDEDHFIHFFPQIMSHYTILTFGTCPSLNSWYSMPNRMVSNRGLYCSCCDCNVKTSVTRNCCVGVSGGALDFWLYISRSLVSPFTTFTIILKSTQSLRILPSFQDTWNNNEIKKENTNED